MDLIPLKIVGSIEGSVYNKINPEETKNAVIVDDALISFMGYKSIASFSGQARGYYTSVILDAQIVVFGKTVYKINLPLQEVIGELETEIGSVEFAENFNKEIAIIDGTAYYVYNYSTNTFAKHDIGFIPSCLAFDDRFGIIFAGIKDTNLYRYTSPNNALDWDPFNENQIGNDIVVALKNFKSILFVMGKKRTLTYRNIGAAFNPYQQDQSGTMDFGALNKDAVSSGFDYIVWVATSVEGNITIVASKGGARPDRILSPKLQFELSNFKNPHVCDSTIFQEYGIVWYQVTFQNDNRTLLIDLNNVKYYYLTDENNKAHILKYLTFFRNQYLFLSRNDSNIYQLSSDFTDYNGKDIERLRITDRTSFPGLYGKRIIYLELILEQGEGVIPTACFVAASFDGGASYTSNVLLKLAPLGKRRQLARLNNIGLAREVSFRFLFVGRNRLVVISAQIGVI